jgi:hypothetical protein
MMEVILVAGIVGCAVFYIARMGWRMYQGKQSTCGCGETECAKKTGR